MANNPSKVSLKIWTDTMSDAELDDYLMSWIDEGSIQQNEDNQISIYQNSIIPRSIFLKNLPAGANVVDIGAGDGGLLTYKNWPAIVRSDIDMFAVSLDDNERFEMYTDRRIGNLETDDLTFEGIQFDGVICCHLIEHLSKLDIFFDYLTKTTIAGSRCYVEWPHPESLRMPRMRKFTAKNFPTLTTNFFDDPTHQHTWDINDVIRKFDEHGFSIESVGRIHFPYLSEALKEKAKSQQDRVAGTFAIWFKTGWSQYVVARRN